MEDDVCKGGDTSFVVASHCMHHGPTYITEYVMHSECEGGVEFDNLSDDFSVVVGPGVDSFEDVGGHGGVWLKSRKMLKHPLVCVVAIIEEVLCFVDFVSSN